MDEAFKATPSVFGISDTEIETVSWAEFYPNVGGPFSSDVVAANGGYRWTTGANTFMCAPLPSSIPNGALITEISWYVRDTNGADNFTGSLARYWRDSPSGLDPGGAVFSAVSSSGSPGDDFLGDAINHTVQRRANVDADPAIEVVNYVLFANTPPGDGTVRLGMVRIVWRRQVSPAPALATFGDVLPGDPQFPFVEALVAAGITAGCGGGNYCPNDPVTRGQMAVFIAAALGLHWPAF